jgi:hypothetical protein
MMRDGDRLCHNSLTSTGGAPQVNFLFCQVSPAPTNDPHSLPEQIQPRPAHPHTCTSLEMAPMTTVAMRALALFAVVVVVAAAPARRTRPFGEGDIPPGSHLRGQLARCGSNRVGN